MDGDLRGVAAALLLLLPQQVLGEGLRVMIVNNKCLKEGRQAGFATTTKVDQNLTTDFFAELPTELPTMATMVTMLAALKYGYILTDDL